ncbi:hypothetical protein ACA910_008565 [Epithemia clementina (nom. ined.)]
MLRFLIIQAYFALFLLTNAHAWVQQPYFNHAVRDGRTFLRLHPDQAHELAAMAQAHMKEIQERGGSKIVANADVRSKRMIVGVQWMNESARH